MSRLERAPAFAVRVPSWIPREGIDRLLRMLARATVALLVTTIISQLGPPPRALAIGTAPPLLTAGSFAVLAGGTATNTGPTIVNGDLGVSPGSAVVGFPPGVVVGGVIHAADAVAAQAQLDSTAAYLNLAGQACDTNLTGMDLGGMTLTPGVYCFATSAFLSAGTLTLNALGNPNAVFVFQIGSTLITGSGTSVNIINGGQDCNVFWQVGSSATLGTTTAFRGNILALASITLNTGATLVGRALAQTGAVTMDSNVITKTLCNVATSLDLTKTDSPDPVIAGQNLTYVLTVTNTGPGTASNVTITDNLPANTVLVSATPSAGGVCTLLTGNVEQCVWAGSTAAGGVRSVTIVVRVCPDALCGTTLVNTAIASEAGGATDTATATTTIATRSELSIVKTRTSPVGIVTAGQNVTYSIVVTNAGPSNSANTIVTDVLSANLRFVSATSTLGTCSAVGQTVTCNLGTLGAPAQCATTPVAQTATITLVARTCPEALCGSSISNTATVNGGNLACANNLPELNQADNSSTVNTSVQTQSDLSIVKTQTSPPGNVVIAGQNVTYNIAVTNSGPSNSVNTVVTDILPANLQFVSATSTVGTCAAVGQTVTCTIGSLGPVGIAQCAGTPLATGAVITLVARTCPEAVCGSLIANTASVTGGDPTCETFNLPDPNLANNSSTVNTTVQTRSDLSIVKTQTSPAGNVVIAGQNVVYSIVVSNAGPSNSLNTVVTDILSANLTFVSAVSTVGACSAVGQTVTCNLGSLGPVGITQCTTGTPLPTTATITLTARTCPEAVCGAIIANTASVTGGPVACASNLADPTPANNTSTVNTTVQTQSDLSIVKTQTSPAGNVVIAGQNVVYSIVVSNAGPSNSLNTVVTDILSANLAYVSATSTLGTCSAVGQTVTCNLGSLGPVGITQCTTGTPLPTTATITLTARTCPEAVCGAIIANTATVAGGPVGCASNLADPTPANNTSTINTTVQTRSDLSIVKTQTSPAGNVVVAGQNVTYSIVVTNSGPSNSINTVVTDILSANLAFVSATSTLGTCSAVGQTVTCNVGTMGPVGITQCAATPLPTTATITLVARTCPEAVCGTVFANTATVTGGPVGCASNLADPTPTNNTSTTNATVQTRSDLSITKTATPSTAIAGQNVTYSIVATNSGPSNASGVVVVDTLPAQTAFVSVTTTLGTCTVVGGVVTCTLGAMGPTGIPQCTIGAPLPTQATITIVVRVLPDTPSSDPACGCNGAPLSNVATIASGVGVPLCAGQQPDPTPANNTATLLTQVRAGSNVSIEEPVIEGPTCFAAGDRLTITQSFTNGGPCAVQDQPDGPGPEYEVNLPATVIGQPGTCVVVQGGGSCTITATQVTWNGVVVVGGTVIVQYQVRLRGGLEIGTEFCFPGQVHFDKCNLSKSASAAATGCATVNCPSIINPNGQLANQVHLPILNFEGQDDVCESWIEVQNLGCSDAMAALVTWGEPGFCPPQAAGPLKVECSGVLKPGSTWNLMGAQVPTGSKSGILFKLSGNQLSEDGIDVGFDDVTGSYVCELLFFGVVGDADDYRRFKKAYDEGLDFQGVDMDLAVPSDGALAVDVHRTCPGDVTPGVDVTSKYNGIGGTHLGVYDDVYGGYAFYVPLVYASKAGYNSILYIQNGGLMCSSIEIWFQQQEDCLRATICDIATLAPGETYQLDANDCVGPDFQGSAWIRATQRMGIVVDIIGHDLLMTYMGEPAEINYTFDPRKATYTAGNQVGFAPLVYSEYQGWDSAIQVQNLSPIVAAKVKVYFLDRSGDIITTLIDWVCPRGSQTFFLPLVAALPGNWVGSARVESQEWIAPGSPNVLAPNVVAVATLVKYGDAARTTATQGIAYNLLPEHKVFDWQIGERSGGGFEAGVGLIAIPSLLKDIGGNSQMTSEVAIANVVPKPGFTDLVIYVYDQNGLVDYVCQKLNEKQVEYIDLQTWGWLNNGFKGSAIISAWFWEHDVFDGTGFFLRNLVGLAAMSIERQGGRLGEDIPGDEAAGERGIPFANTFDDKGRPIFEYCFLGPLPLCPGFADLRPKACEVKQESFACANCPVAIPNAGVAQTAIANVINHEGCTVADVDITLDIAHTWIGDLDIDVSSPKTGRIPIIRDICDNGPVANIQAVVDSDAAQTLGAVCPPAPAFAHAKPGGGGVDPAALDEFDKLDATGQWKLDITDDTGGDSGSVNGWSVDITYR